MKTVSRFLIFLLIPLSLMGAFDKEYQFSESIPTELKLLINSLKIYKLAEFEIEETHTRLLNIGKYLGDYSKEESFSLIKSEISKSLLGLESSRRYEKRDYRLPDFTTLEAKLKNLEGNSFLSWYGNSFKKSLKNVTLTREFRRLQQNPDLYQGKIKTKIDYLLPIYKWFTETPPPQIQSRMKILTLELLVKLENILSLSSKFTKRTTKKTDPAIILKSTQTEMKLTEKLERAIPDATQSENEASFESSETDDESQANWEPKDEPSLTVEASPTPSSWFSTLPEDPNELFAPLFPTPVPNYVAPTELPAPSNDW